MFKKFKFDVLTIGSAVRDTMFIADGKLLELTEPYVHKVFAFEYGAKFDIQNVYKTNGGGACNTAVNFSRLGFKVCTFAAVGLDEEGENIIKDLNNLGVYTKFIQKIKNEHTAFSTIISYKKHSVGEHIIFHYSGAGRFLDFSVNNLIKVKPRIIYLCSLKSKKWRKCIDNIVNYKKSNSQIIWAWNPGNLQLLKGFKYLKKFLKYVDILILNKFEASELLSTKGIIKKNFSIQDLLIEIYKSGIKILVITDGKNGAYAFNGDKIFYSPIYRKVKTVDLTGVGDAFGSTFVFAMDQYNDIKKSLRLASINAAYVSSKVGAQKGSLSKAVLEKKLKCGF